MAVVGHGLSAEPDADRAVPEGEEARHARSWTLRGGARRGPYPVVRGIRRRTRSPTPPWSWSRPPVALLIGYTWGSGTLTFDGKSYAVEIDGLSVLAIGVVQAKASAEVFNLKSLADFNGTYVAAKHRRHGRGGRGRHDHAEPERRGHPALHDDRGAQPQAGARRHPAQFQATSDHPECAMSTLTRRHQCTPRRPPCPRRAVRTCLWMVLALTPLGCATRQQLLEMETEFKARMTKMEAGLATEKGRVDKLTTRTGRGERDGHRGDPHRHGRRPVSARTPSKAPTRPRPKARRWTARVTTALGQPPCAHAGAGVQGACSTGARSSCPQQPSKP